MKIVLGIFFIGILPVLFVLLQKKRGFFLEKEFQRRMIYLLALINMCGVLLWMGNAEVAFSVLLGSSLFHLLVVEGISSIQGKDNKADVFANHFDAGKDKKGFFDVQGKIFGRMESSGMFLSISFIILLLLCGDYLFKRGQGQNILGRVDGCILILAGAIYFFLEGKRIGWKILTEKIRNVLQKDLLQKMILFFILEGSILVGSYLLVDGMLAVSIHASIIPYIVGFLFLSWCMNLVNIDLVSPSQDTLPGTSNQEAIFSITVLMGICAVCRVIYISMYQIYDIILISLISILIILPIKIDSRLMGCCKVTAYFVLVFYILFR